MGQNWFRVGRVASCLSYPHPQNHLIGALLGIGIMLGALFSHLTQLGIVVQNDGGTLFILALVTLAFCLILAWQNRSRIPLVKNLF